jgi:hypothetical protein
MSMKQVAFDTHKVEKEGLCTPLQSTTIESSSPTSILKEAACSALSVSELVSHCLREITYRRREPWTDVYGLELLRRATVQRDQTALKGVQHCFSGMVHSWLRHHSLKKIACRLESEENYVVQTFERFWQTTTLIKRVEFHSLAAALQYLRVSLNGVILDALRTYPRPRELLLQEPGAGWEQHVDDNTDSYEVWETFQTRDSNEREQRLAYLLFHCGLRPNDIVHTFPEELHDVHEISLLRCTIIDRLLDQVDQHM